MGILSVIYKMITRFRNYLYDIFFLKVHKVNGVKVVCIGNITVGGTGKTPAVQYFAKKYLELGYKVAIVSRGYKGRRKRDPFVVRDYERIMGTVKTSGDEAMLHSNKLEIPVIVSKNRFEGALLASKVYACDLVILDDGFQHRKLWRDKDVVLIDATNPFGGEKILPQGRLREELKGLERAKEFIITKADLVPKEEIDTIKDRLSIYNKLVSVASHGPKSLYNSKNKELKLESIKGKKVLLFSALANPQQFTETIKKYNPKEIEVISFKDHHLYKVKDYELIRNKAKEFGAQLIISTEKDYVKFKDKLEMDKLYVLAIEFNLLEDNICWNF